MHLARRTLLGSGAAAVIAAAVSGGTPRGEDSGGNATMIVPFAPGGGSDQSGRALADGLEQALGNSISVENIQGGSGAIGYSTFLGMHGDASQLLATETAMMVLPLTQDVRFSYRDFTPIFKAGDDYTLVVTRPDAPYADAAELVQAARERSVLVGVSGATSLDEIVFSLVEKDQDMRFDRVPYESGGEVLAALLGGHIEAASLNPSEVIGQLASGDLRALCALTPERFEAEELRDIPTGREQGIDVAFAQFRGVIAPGGITDQQRERWVQAARDYVSTDAYRSYLEENYMVEEPLFGDDFGPYLDRYHDDLAEALA